VASIPPVAPVDDVAPTIRFSKGTTSRGLKSVDPETHKIEIDGFASDESGVSIVTINGNIASLSIAPQGELIGKEIAPRIGFKNADYFCTWFQNQTGQSPTAFQREHSESN